MGPLLSSAGVELDQPAVLGTRTKGASLAGNDEPTVSSQGNGVGEFVPVAPQSDAPFGRGLRRNNTKAQRHHGESQRYGDQRSQAAGLAAAQIS